MEENQFEILMEDEGIEGILQQQQQLEIVLDSGHRINMENGHGLEGWVMKQRRYKKTWQARWCCLLRDSWWIWGEAENKEIHGAVDLASIIEVDAIGTTELRLLSRDKAIGTVILRAETPKLRDAWISSLCEGIKKRVQMLKQGRERLEKIRRRPSLFTKSVSTTANTYDSLWPSLSQEGEENIIIEGYAKKRAIDDFKGVKPKTTRRAFARAKMQLSVGDDSSAWTPRYIVALRRSDDNVIIAYARSKQDRQRKIYAGEFSVNADTIVKVERQPVGGRKKLGTNDELEEDDDDPLINKQHNPLRSQVKNSTSACTTAAAADGDTSHLLGPARLAIETIGLGRLRLEFIDAAEAAIWLSRLDEAVRAMRMLRNRSASDAAQAFENKLKSPALLSSETEEAPPLAPLPLANRENLIIWHRGKVEGQVNISDDAKNRRKTRVRLVRCDVLSAEMAREGNYTLEIFEDLGQVRLNLPLLGATLSTLDPELQVTDHGDDFVLVIKTVDRDDLWLRFERKAKRSDWFTTLQALIDAALARNQAQDTISLVADSTSSPHNDITTVETTTNKIVSQPPPPPPPPPLDTIPPPPPPPPLMHNPPPPPPPPPQQEQEKIQAHPQPPPSVANAQPVVVKMKDLSPVAVDAADDAPIYEQLQPRFDRNPQTAKLTPPPFVAPPPPIRQYNNKKKKTHRGSHHHHHHHKKHHTVLNAIGTAAPPPPPNAAATK